MRQSLRLLFFLTAITFLSGSVMAQEGSAKGRMQKDGNTLFHLILQVNDTQLLYA